LVKPNSKIDAAICAICSAECVRAFLAYGTSRSVGQISMRRAIAGVIVAGIVAIGLRTTTGSPTLDIRPGLRRNRPPFRAPVPRVAPFGSGLAGWSTRRLGRALAATDR